MLHRYALTSAFMLASATAFAQTAPAAPVGQPQAAMDAPIGNVLRAGTPVALRMSEPLSTEGKKLRPGHRFLLEVVEPVTVDGQVVVPAGSPATGEVTDVRNKGMWGKSGRINARVLFVRANGRQVRMTGQVEDKGTTGTAAVAGSIVLLPVAGFFVTGTSANIPSGAPVNGFIDEDLPITSTHPVQRP